MENAFIYHSPARISALGMAEVIFFKYTLITKLFFHDLVYMSCLCDFLLMFNIVIKLKIKHIEGQL